MKKSFASFNVLIILFLIAVIMEINTFQKKLHYIGLEYAEDYINNGEDVIMSLSLYHLTKSYYIMKEIVYYHAFRWKKRLKKIHINIMVR